MRAGSSIALGVATLWPLLYMVFFFVVIGGAFVTGGEESGDLPIPEALLFGLHLLTMLVIIGLLAIYIVNVFRNERVATEQKALWAVVLFLGNFFAMPVYWWLYLRPGRASAAKTPRDGNPPVGEP